MILIMSHELPNMGGLTQTVDEALLGWWHEGPTALVLALLGVVVGWKDRTTRGLAMGVLGSWCFYCWRVSHSDISGTITCESSWPQRWPAGLECPA